MSSDNSGDDDSHSSDEEGGGTKFFSFGMGHISGKRKSKRRSSFSIEAKVEAAEAYLDAKRRNKFLSMDAFLWTYNTKVKISKQLLSKWIKKKQILDSIPDANSRKRMRYGVYTEVEDAVVRYLDKRKALFKIDKCGVSYDVIRACAFRYVERLCLDNDTKREEFKSFHASDHWIYNFINRSGSVNLKLHGEKGDIDEEAAAVAMEDFRSRCKITHPFKYFVIVNN